MPEKRLLTQDDMGIWANCETRHKLEGFIACLAHAIEGRENTQYAEPISGGIACVMDLLAEVEATVVRHPVGQDGTDSRFGKVEFRDFYDELNNRVVQIITKHFNTLVMPQVEQLKTYLVESWGNRQRIDYGSGHELNFICFLYGLCQYKVLDLKSTDATNLILKVFIEYIRIMRILQTTYWLEPAGSHGVWGLDDYHFLPFLFGAFQLAPHKHLKPMSIHDEDIAEMFASKYMYFGCIAFINSVKTTASLRWHSPMLDDISGVKKWSKVAEGMIKMYKAEVLSKLPIMQHFYFSEFLPCPEGVSKYHAQHNEEIEHSHVHSTWGDCCGIKLPSAIAANAMEKKTHKPLPFD